MGEVELKQLEFRDCCAYIFTETCLVKSSVGVVGGQMKTKTEQEDKKINLFSKVEICFKILKHLKNVMCGFDFTCADSP